MSSKAPECDGAGAGKGVGRDRGQWVVVEKSAGNFKQNLPPGEEICTHNVWRDGRPINVLASMNVMRLKPSPLQPNGVLSII